MQKLITILLAIMVLTIADNLNAATYYVDSQNGNDQNNGQSSSSPLKTLTAMSSKTLQAGDAVLLKRGSTWTETFNINYSGSASSPITISAYGTGNQPVIDAELVRDNGIFISGKSNVNFKNLNVINAIGSGQIRIQYATNVNVDSCSFYITGHGGVFIENSTKCKISHSVFRTLSDATPVQTDGIYSQRNSFITFDGNDILITAQNVDQHDDGIQSYLDTSLTFCNNNIEQRNTKTANAQGIYATTGAGTFTAYNNVVNCPNSQAHTFGIRNLTTGTAGARVYNNTFINGGSNALRISEASDIVIKNNIIVSKNAKSSLYLDNAVNDLTKINNNLYYANGSSTPIYYGPAGGYKSLSQWQALGADLNGKVADPLLTSDLSITQNSPALDAGQDLGSLVSYDIEGTSRPQLKASDIGAFELKSVSALPVELTNFTAQLSGSDVNLEWNTATENNNYGFSVERKTADGWEEITFIQGAGNSNATKAYNYVDKNVKGRSVTYRLKQVDVNGTFAFSKEVEVAVNVASYYISQNYPNPFNPSTNLDYYIPQEGRVTIAVYNVTGERLAELENSVKASGSYKINWNAGNYASGVYFLKITVQGLNGESQFSDTKKLNLIK